MRGPARLYMHTLSPFMRVFETPVDVYGRISVLAHDDAGVGAADEVAAIYSLLTSNGSLLHCGPPSAR